MRSLLFGLIFTFISQVAVAGEGMWLPLLLKSLNEAEMQQLGMKLSAEDIYSVNRGSLKDAIVHFGGFCTSELISPDGLLLTNHHCGYGQIQQHSSLEHNYLKNGFWAMDRNQELPNPGLTATFINEIMDVTDRVLAFVNDDMTVSERQTMVDKNISKLRKNFELEEYQDLVVRPFFEGNQYFAFITTTYRDVRLVGAPPESIGKFGADTDNWVWPRHTGDFSLFRIYAGPDNLPADYSDENVPLKSKHFLPISLDGVEPGDFTMVFGFPGRTSEYLPSYAIKQLVEKLNPAKIKIRETALSILDKYMREDETVRIQYASKFARVANYWKKWIGESMGLERTKAIEKKEKYEKRFTSALPKDSPYRTILPEFEKLYKDRAPLAFVRDYYSELTGRNIEMMRLVRMGQSLVSNYENNGEESFIEYRDRVKPSVESFFKDYKAEIDSEVFEALTKLYKSNVDKAYVPRMMHAKNDEDMNGRSTNSSDFVLHHTVFNKKDKLLAVLEMEPSEAVETLKNDPLYKFGEQWKMLYDEKVANPLNKIQFRMDSLQRIYMKAQMEVFPNKVFYPDANSTMRLTYGQVNGYSPQDAVYYTPVTHLEGVIEKYVPGDYEFDISDKLLELYRTKDYGPYADANGKMPVCFIGTNHTTGGNSGSPAIDAHGNLIGLNFDRAWEGTMSDYNYDPTICRNIMVDARYILFVIDKYAGAGHLIEEMKLVHPKSEME